MAPHLLLLISLLGCIATQSIFAVDKWTDVHFHVVGDRNGHNGFKYAADKVIRIMDDYDMGRAVIMSPPRPFRSYDIEELKAIQQQYPTRISIMGGGGTLNPMIQNNKHKPEISEEVKQRFEARAEEIMAQGAVGFGEMTAHHVSLGPGHGYESVPADHPLFLMLSDIAARYNVPIDMHFDPIPGDMDKPHSLFSPKNPERLKENISGFERLLTHNRNTKIVWAHAGSDPVGFYTPDLVRRLMKDHPNLYCSIRTTYKKNGPMVHPRDGINVAWIRVLEEFPDRFVMGTDSFVITSDYTGPQGPRKFARRTQVQRSGAVELLSYLDDDLRRKIGTENARRIYRIDDTTPRLTTITSPALSTNTSSRSDISANYDKEKMQMLIGYKVSGRNKKNASIFMKLNKNGSAHITVTPPKKKISPWSEEGRWWVTTTGKLCFKADRFARGQKLCRKIIGSGKKMTLQANNPSLPEWVLTE